MDRTESKGKAENMVHGVVFRLEIERLRDTIMAHIVDHEETLRPTIDRAIADCMVNAGDDIRVTVNRVTRDAIESMVRQKTQEVLWDGEFEKLITDYARKKARAMLKDVV